MMKKLAYFLMFGATIALTSCGGEEPATEDTNSAAETEVNESNNPLENLMQQGINEAFEEVTEQLADSTSALHDAMDTLQDVLEDNKDLIEDAVSEGIDALNKSL